MSTDGDGNNALATVGSTNTSKKQLATKFKTSKSSPVGVDKNLATIKPRLSQSKILIWDEVNTPQPNTKEMTDDKSTASSPDEKRMSVKLPSPDDNAADYAQLIQKQVVRILRRPTQSSELQHCSNKPRQPLKTLQQREQEYAEARLRILGAAEFPSDDSTTTTTTITTKAVAMKFNTNSQAKSMNNVIRKQESKQQSVLSEQNQQQQQHQQKSQQQQNMTATTDFNNCFQQLQQQNTYFPQQQCFFKAHQQQSNSHHSMLPPSYTNNRALLPTPVVAPMLHQHYRWQQSPFHNNQQHAQQESSQQQTNWPTVSYVCQQRQQQPPQQHQQQHFDMWSRWVDGMMSNAPLMRCDFQKLSDPSHRK